jgi:hypothetical protein
MDQSLTGRRNKDGPLSSLGNPTTEGTRGQSMMRAIGQDASAMRVSPDEPSGVMTSQEGILTTE